MKRDRLVNRTLRKMGWRVVRIWEHELKGDGTAAIRRIRRALEAVRPAASRRMAARRRRACPG